MEIEFKFQVPPSRLQALQKELAVGEPGRTQLKARYFDTAGGALADRGLVLRIRKEGPRWVQTAKATVAGNGPLRRLEHNVELDLDAASVFAPPDVQRHAGSRVGKLLARALQHCDEPLVEIFVTDISRWTRLEQVGHTTVELALDVGKVVAGAGSAATRHRRESPVCELELELVKGDVSALVDVARRWSQRHGLWLSTLSKAERGRRLVSPHSAKPSKAIAPVFNKAHGAELSAVGVQRAIISACLGQVLPNASEVAHGVESPETVHQLRVGLRRLRTALRELEGLGQVASGDARLRPQLPGEIEPAKEAALRKVFLALGAHRDSQLLTDELQPRLRKAGAPQMDLPLAVPHDSGVGDAVRAAGFQSALVALIGFAEGANAAPECATKNESRLASASVQLALRKRLNKLFEQILRDGKRFKSLSPDAQHRVRKRLKRLRYLSEFVAPLFGDRAAAHFVSRLVPTQDALGVLNDEAVAVEHYRQATKAEPRAWFAVGWLSASHAGNVASCQAQLVKFAKVRPFWGKG